MKTVKYHCDKCKYAEDYSSKELFFKQLWSFGSTVLIALGILFVVFLFLMKPGFFLSSFLVAKVDVLNREDVLWLREFTLNATGSGCGDDSFCYAVQLYHEVEGVDYIPANVVYPLLNSRRVFDEGGDCKNSAAMFVSMLHSVGVNARVSCSFSARHCVSVVPNYWLNEFERGFLVVDLTTPQIKYVNSSEFIWDYVVVGVDASEWY